MQRDWLIALRKEAGLKQKDVAEKIKRSRPSYCDIEHGKMNPSVKTAKAIAAVLGFDWVRFFDEKTSPQSGEEGANEYH